VPAVAATKAGLAVVAPVSVTAGPAVCFQAQESTTPSEPLPSRVTVWPAVAVAGAVATATGASAAIAGPAPVTGTVVEPPLDEVTVTVAGGATTPVNPVALSAPNPVTVRTPGVASRSLDSAATVRVCWVAS
jgi:hypothetical protein